jgi:protocatechuate 3,4-dioxygenase beta subunit
VAESRRKTLISIPVSAEGWRFDIRLGGADETVFFDL